MQDCTHLSRFALVSRAFPGRNAKKYTGYCIIACVLTWHVAPKKISLESSGDIRVAKDNIDKLARIHTAKF